MRRIIPVLAGLGLLAAAAGVLAQDRPALQIPRVASPPVLERYLDGTTVPPGVKVTDFKQREPGDGVPASRETAVYLSYDAQHLYAVFVCQDEPDKVRANMTRREAIGGDDVVAVILDTYHDGRRSYIFMTNPLGIQMDGIGSEGQEDDYSYDTLWRSDGRLTRDGYVVLFAIPFRSLRFAREDAQTWGIAVGRIITRLNETSFWPYITRRIAGFGQQMATLEGIEGASPGRNLQVIPYGSFATARFLDPDGIQRTQSTGQAGLDGKAVIEDAVTVDLTVNPDFSQVESDEPQVTINQRFEVFFPEKRPFFIENAGYFETPQNLFFSRRVADPLAGARVTGRSSGWAYAGLLVNDERPGDEVATDDPRHGDLAAIGVARVQRQFARQSNLGAIFTDREFGGSGNRVYGVDGRWKIDDNWSLTGQWVGSSTTDEAGRDTTGSSAYAALERSGRGFEYRGSFLSRSPEFRAELGYIPRVDLRETQQEASYMWHPANSRVLRVGPDVEASALWNYAGDLEEWVVEPGFEIEFPGNTEIGVRHWNTFERFEGEDFRHHTTGLFASSQWLSWISVNAFWEMGTGINYYPAEGLRPFLADRQEVELGVTLRPTPRLRLDETYLFSGLWTRGNEDVPPGATGRIFANHILRSRVNYQFTRALSGRVILDYEAVLPDEALVSLEEEKRLALDLLFTYLVNPWTAVYVGYTDAYENLVPDGPMQRPVTRGGGATTSVGRQVFAKVSYLFRF